MTKNRPGHQSDPDSVWLERYYKVIASVYGLVGIKAVITVVEPRIMPDYGHVSFAIFTVSVLAVSLVVLMVKGRKRPTKLTGKDGDGSLPAK